MTAATGDRSMMLSPLVRLTTGLVLVVVASGCNPEALTKTNDNPNSPTDAPAGPVFTSAVRSGVGRWMGDYNYSQTSNLVQFYAMNQYSDPDRYFGIRADATTGNFDASYSGELQDFRQVANKGAALDAPGVWGPAHIMQSWEFSVLTNTYGDIPYTEALKGDSSILTPKYDAQKDVYAGLFSVLDAASKAIASAPSGSAVLGSADPIFGGNLLRWQRFANSLRARLALQLVNVDKATSETQLRAALAAPGGLVQSAADEARLVWPGDGIYDNPFANTLKTRDDRRLSRTLMDTLAKLGDPRIPIYAQPAVDKSLYPGGYGGMPNGLTQDSATKWSTLASRPGAIFFPGNTTYGTYGSAVGATTPSVLLSNAEVQFIQAEAAERSLGGLSPSQAAAFYEAGILASMAQWNVPATTAAAYVAKASIKYLGGVAGLKQIATQKWIALFDNGPQAWNEWRRTCQPAVIRPGPSAYVPYVPRRFFYSTTEASSNATNLQSAIARQGADDFKTRVYWDKAPAAAPTYVDVASCGLG
jgi:hypothetical protein